MISQEMKIRKGQAYNLAVSDAISKGEQNNPKYIYQQFVYYFTLAGVVQSSDLDMIQEVLNNKDFDKVIKDLQKVMK